MWVWVCMCTRVCGIRAHPPIHTHPHTHTLPSQEAEKGDVLDALVDLTAADGGFGEWYEHIWMRALSEARAKANAAAGIKPAIGGGGANGNGNGGARPGGYQALV